jgi:tRNA(His) 5'-end guanylyltransferase
LLDQEREYATQFIVVARAYATLRIVGRQIFTNGSKADRYKLPMQKARLILLRFAARAVLRARVLGMCICVAHVDNNVY